MRDGGGTRTCWPRSANMTFTIGMEPSFTISPVRQCAARPREGVSLRLAAQSQVLAVHDVHDIIVPPVHFGFDQVLVDVEVDRQHWMVTQHDALGTLQQLAAPV